MGNGLTLGITKAGDILLKDKISNVITDKGEVKSIDDIKLIIPEYQRPYKWTVKNANQLLNDIKDAMNCNKEIYRVGTLILHHDKDDSYNIVDGQQRTITFALLLKALNNQFPITFINQKLSNNSYSIHNIMNNFRSFERQIAKLLNDNVKKILVDYITNHCELIVVITEDQSEAFQFFDSQNARGRALYPHDLLKAYHLREMNNLDAAEIEFIVKIWEELNQKKLAGLFNEYLYRLKEWVKGNRSNSLTEHNIELFKGITARDKHPYAQYYKGAFAFADNLNNSNMPFVTGTQKMTPFQIDAPIVAGKPFFEYAKHYFDILADIQDNKKYEGYYMNDNDIVKTLDQREYKNGVGNNITRLMFDTSILLYVDRFCPTIPSKIDIESLEQFVVFAFVWAYSMRAQYVNVGWQVAQNFIMGNTVKDGVVNGFNVYKIIAESDSPNALLSKMADSLSPLRQRNVKKIPNRIDEKDDNGVYKYYLYYFKKHNYLEE